MELRCTSPNNKLLLLAQHLLLLSHMATAVDLKITQHPPEVNISKGDSVVMMCSWTISHMESIRVNWLKDRISIFTNTSGEHREGSRKYVVGTNYSSLTILSARLNDSARYLCEVLVEIPPPVRRARGEGTIIKVSDIVVDAKKNFIMWILAAVCPILLIVVFALCCCFWKAKCRLWNDNLEYENTTAIKKEAVERKKEKSSELGPDCRKSRIKSDNIYENISVEEQRKRQTKNKVIK